MVSAQGKRQLAHSACSCGWFETAAQAAPISGRLHAAGLVVLALHSRRAHDPLSTPAERGCKTAPHLRADRRPFAAEPAIKRKRASGEFKQSIGIIHSPLCPAAAPLWRGPLL